MEGKILLALKFNLNYTTPLQILEAMAEKWTKDNSGKLTKDSIRLVNMSKYVIELALFDGLGKEYCMKTLTESAVMLSQSVLKVREGERSKGDQVMRCFKEMCITLTNVSRPTLKLKAIKKKYSQEKYMGVARVRIDAK